MRSKTSSVSHPDGLPDLFLDRSLGRKIVPGLLRAAGLRLLTLAEHYGIPADEGIADEEWLALAGTAGWVVLMRDTDPVQPGRARGRPATCRPLLLSHPSGPRRRGDGGAVRRQPRGDDRSMRRARTVHLRGPPGSHRAPHDQRPVTSGFDHHRPPLTRPQNPGAFLRGSARATGRRSDFRRRVWLPATEAIGLAGFRFHDLRHTGATLAAATGAPLRAIM
jgi:hypothetical protein